MDIPSVANLLEGVPLIDGHNDLVTKLRRKEGYSVERLGVQRDELHTDVVKLRRGKVGAQFWSVWAPSDISEEGAALGILEQIDAVYRLIAKYPDVLRLACTADDVEREFAAGRIASLIGLEGGHCIAESLGTLRVFARLGVRYMTLTHNDDTSWAASATGSRQTSGLSDTGKAIVREMNRIGIIVDLSHTAESTQLDALSTGSAPAIFSHSSCRAVTEHARNVSDEVLAKLVENDGVIQLSFVPDFVAQRCIGWRTEMVAQRVALGLTHEVHMKSVRVGVAGGSAMFGLGPRPGETAESVKQRNQELRDSGMTRDCDDVAKSAFGDWLTSHPRPQASLADVADHIEHARHIAGAGHIGIGSDYEGTPAVPTGLENVGTFPALFAELSSRGWSTEDLQKLAGRNMLRVMRAVENAASEPMWPTCATN